MFFFVVSNHPKQIRCLVLSDEQMSKGWPFFLLNAEQRVPNNLGVEHQPVQHFVDLKQFDLFKVQGVLCLLSSRIYYGIHMRFTMRASFREYI